MESKPSAVVPDIVAMTVLRKTQERQRALEELAPRPPGPHRIITVLWVMAAWVLPFISYELLPDQSMGLLKSLSSFLFAVLVFLVHEVWEMRRQIKALTLLLSEPESLRHAP